MKKITYYLCLLFAVFLIPAEADTALLPHQGRVLLNGEPFDGIGYFRFALVSRNDPGSIRWNHQGGIDFPDSNISLPVNNGFYQVKLGDVSVPGMATLPDDLLTYEDPFSLRIWFGSQNTELQQLGPDQPLQIAPYAITTKWTSADEFASRFSNEIDNKANTENTTSDSIIERIISLGSKAPEEDFDGLIPMSMLDSELTARLDTFEQDINESKVNITSINLENASFSDSFEDLEDNMSSLDQGIQANASNLEDLNQSVSLHLGILDANVSSLDQSIQANASNLEDLNQSVSLHLGILDANVSSLDQGIQVNASKLEDLNQSVSLHLEILDANVSSLDQGIQANASNLEDLNQSIALQIVTLENNISYVGNREVTMAMLDDQLLSYLVPVITQQPYLVSLPSGNVYEGQSIEIHVGVDGRNLSYQWRKDDGNLTGETNSSLVLTNANAAQHDGNYSVEVRNIFGSELSLSMELDINGSGTIGPLGSSHFVKSADNMELLWVPAGSFTMGNANDGESDNSPYEVTITQGFYLGKFEVTQSEYIAVTSSNPSWHRGASLPVDSVSWDDINSSFLTTLNQSAKENGSLPAGWSYALPSEAEWEFACRAGTESNYSFGNSIDWKLANYNLDANRSLEPGSYPPNGLGFFDMHGNVAEWVMDIYDANYYGSSPTDPTGPTTGDNRVFRGGSYNSSKPQSSYRNYNPPEEKNRNHGFRLALKKDQ